MTRLLATSVLVLAALSATGAAQPAAGSAAAPAAGSAATPASPDAPPAPPPASASDARKACTAAMNADPSFAAEIVKVADQKAAAQRDADTVKAHEDANFHVQKNEKHVIYAYAAMWIVAAAFVLFLWRRQQALKLEIAHLRRDLDAAASDTAAKEQKS